MTHSRTRRDRTRCDSAKERSRTRRVERARKAAAIVAWLAFA